MGSHTFGNTIGGKKMTPNEAYKTLCDDALHEHGHDAYNGTISTTSGFVLVALPPRKELHKFIFDLLEEEDRQIQKWGPAGCIELRGKALTDWKRNNGLAGTRARAFTFFGWAAS